MTILNFYQKLATVPANLIRHHLEVGAVTWLILHHWQGPKIDQELTLRTALLHDVGNLVKYTFPLEHQIYHEIIDDEAYWYRKQCQLISKYGRDADLTTRNLLKKFGFLSEARLLAEVHLAKYTNKLKNVSDEAKIVFLADGSVSPVGIVGVEARIEDVKKRYTGNEKMHLWVKALRKNQVLLQERVDLNLSQLQDCDYYRIVNRLKKWPLAVG